MNSQAIIDKDLAANSFKTTQKSISVNLRAEAYDVQYRSNQDSAELLNRKWKSPSREDIFLESVAVTMPTAIFIALALVMYLKQLGYHPTFIIFSALASYSPLLLHYFAWDRHRFNALAITTSFLVLLVFTSTNNETINVGGKIRPVFLSIFTLVFFSNFYVEIPLFDRYKVKNMPFTEHVIHMKNVIEGKEEFPDIPKF